MKSHLIPLLLFAVLTACSNPSDRSKLLPVALEEFNTALIWRNYAVASQYLPPSRAADELSFYRRTGEKLKLVEVEPMETRFGKDGQSATVLIRFSWYVENDLTVRKGFELQEWRKISGMWRLTGRLPPKDSSADVSPFVSVEPEGEAVEDEAPEPELD